MSTNHSDQPVVIVERSEGGLGGFLLGLAVGAGVALLFAPRTGEETRRQLKNTGRRLRSAASEKAEDLQEALGGGYERTRDRIEEGLETARDTIGEKRETARDAVRAGKAAVKSARSELERRLSESKAARTTARAGATEESSDEDDE
jgi:gas vesicle protein